jgi:hypothetical protein
LLQKPSFMRIGFPWILSSESRLINKLHEIFSGKFFLVVLSDVRSPGGGAGGRGHTEGQDYSSRKSNLISDFLQTIVVRAVLVRLLSPKPTRSQA